MTVSMILASTSPIRRALLASAGVAVEVMPSRVDEDALRASFVDEAVSPRDQADLLAETKARKVASRRPDALVIGCDQVLEFEGEVFTKPADKAELRDQLARLSSRTHTLFSAVVLYERAEPVWRHVGEARMTMRSLSPDFIASYVERNWKDVRHSVGGYQIEAEGVRLFSWIDGSYHTILGLPLLELLSYLTLRKVIEI